MLPYLTDQYGNPHSRTHAYGWEAEQAVEDARKVSISSSWSFTCLIVALQHVADLIGADQKDIVFTSGATESNNLSIKGIARFHKEKKRHIITTQTVRLFRSVYIPLTYQQLRSTNVYLTHAGNLAKRVSTSPIYRCRRAV
jgi:cysteine sulfinate desulfinase/cysteine desulfurase-like protein